MKDTLVKVKKRTNTRYCFSRLSGPAELGPTGRTLEKSICATILLFLLITLFITPATTFAQEVHKKDAFEPRAQSGLQRDMDPNADYVDPQLRHASVENTTSIPGTINVAITDYINCSNWVNAGQPVVRVDTLDFQTYVKNVLPNEWLSWWELNALRAGAMAAKNYAWRKINVGARHYLKDAQNLDKYPDVVDNTCDQVYLPNTQKTSTDNAVNDTWFYTMTRDGLLVRNFYLATEQQCTDSPYQPCMPQWGTQYRAQEGKSWNQIVEQYYNPVTITDLSLSPRAVYRFWSAKYGSHFYTTDIDERNYFIDQYDDDTWHFEGEAFKGADSTDPGAIPVYRFWGPKTKSYFYTANPNEKEEVLAKYPNDWTYQGVKFYVYPDSYPDNYRTVYRFWSDRLQHHFYTANEDEKNYILSHYPTDVWHLEGKAYKVPVN
jgi:hypothetical protein